MVLIVPSRDQMQTEPCVGLCISENDQEAECSKPVEASAVASNLNLELLRRRWPMAQVEQ